MLCLFTFVSAIFSYVVTINEIFGVGWEETRREDLNVTKLLRRRRRVG